MFHLFTCWCRSFILRWQLLLDCSEDLVESCWSLTLLLIGFLFFFVGVHFKFQSGSVLHGSSEVEVVVDRLAEHRSGLIQFGQMVISCCPFMSASAVTGLHSDRLLTFFSLERLHLGVRKDSIAL